MSFFTEWLREVATIYPHADPIDEADEDIYTVLRNLSARVAALESLVDHLSELMGE